MSNPYRESDSPAREPNAVMKIHSHRGISERSMVFKPEYYSKDCSAEYAGQLIRSASQNASMHIYYHKDSAFIKVNDHYIPWSNILSVSIEEIPA